MSSSNITPQPQSAQPAQEHPCETKGLNIDPRLLAVYERSVSTATGHSLELLRQNFTRYQNKFHIDVTQTDQVRKEPEKVATEYIQAIEALGQRWFVYIICYLEHACMRSDVDDPLAPDGDELVRGLEAQYYKAKLQFYLLWIGRELLGSMQHSQRSNYIVETMTKNAFGNQLKLMAYRQFKKYSEAPQNSLHPSSTMTALSERMASIVYQKYGISDVERKNRGEDHLWCPITQRFWSRSAHGIAKIIPDSYGPSIAGTLFDLSDEQAANMPRDWMNMIPMHRVLARLYEAHLATIVTSRPDENGLAVYRFVILDQTVMDSKIEHADVTIYLMELQNRQLAFRNDVRPDVAYVFTHWFTEARVQRGFHLPPPAHGDSMFMEREREIRAFGVWMQRGEYMSEDVILEYYRLVIPEGEWDRQRMSQLIDWYGIQFKKDDNTEEDIEEARRAARVMYFFALYHKAYMTYEL